MTATEIDQQTILDEVPDPTPQVVATDPSADGLGSSRLSRLLRTYLPPAAVFGVFLAAWYGYSSTLSERQRNVVLPYPHEVWSEAFADWENHQEILSGLWITTQTSIVGLFIAILLGVAAAVAMSQAAWVERSFYPYAVTLQAVPILALVPLIGLIWGFEFRSRVLVCVIIAIFPIITNTLFGLKSAESGLHDLFTLHRASRWTRFRKLQLPNALPAMFTGLRISAGLSVIGAIVGEFFFRRGDQGLGILIDKFRQNLEPELVIGAVFWSAVLGIVVFVFFGWLANRMTSSWHESAQTGPQ